MINFVSFCTRQIARHIASIWLDRRRRNLRMMTMKLFSGFEYGCRRQVIHWLYVLGDLSFGASSHLKLTLLDVLRTWNSIQNCYERSRECFHIFTKFLKNIINSIWFRLKVFERTSKYTDLNSSRNDVPCLSNTPESIRLEAQKCLANGSVQETSAKLIKTKQEVTECGIKVDSAFASHSIRTSHLPCTVIYRYQREI